MIGIEEIEDSLEIPIGTRFYFRNHIYEVAEANEPINNQWDCSECAFNKRDKNEICLVMFCDGYRHDKKYIYFKEVEETEEEKQ